ncbi:MAG: B12-binding domain-containing radical SAM protein [Planctomycetota bacterium]|jgi:anaerobic magnesium-protoporphyrin IX monomethyl ester cyclase
MRELFLFVRPPRPIWPYTGPSSAFWPPLAFASLAAALRARVAELDVRILDAPVLRQGWRSLAAELRSLAPAYVGLGEEAVSAKEGLRLARLAQAVGARVVAGGCFFGHLAPEVLRTGLVDAVVHGEGEETIVELVQAWRSGGRRQVAGLSFAEGGEIVRTAARPPLQDLDRLPFPAYDLLPLDRYGRGSRNHPDFAALELSRGCDGSCAFCILWRQMGRFNGSRLVPHLRTKSAERVRDEIRVLVRRYARRYVRWVDPCFNAHPDVPGRVAELLLRDGLAVGQSAWVRADGIVRDHGSGSLARQVRAGLNEVYLGVDRPDRRGLERLRKKGSEPSVVAAALRILSRRHPGVFTVGSYIYGLAGDDEAMMRRLYRHAFELDLDEAFYIPLTPLPGTPFWNAELWDRTGERMRSLDFLPSCQPDGHPSRLARALAAAFLLDWPALRVRGYLRRLCARDARKRRMARRLLWRAIRFSGGLAAEAVLRRGRRTGMRIPSWYER